MNIVREPLQPQRYAGVWIALIGMWAGGCADRPTAVRSDQQVNPAAESQLSATVPDPLRGVWYIDDTEGRTACQKYLTVSAATIEQTGQDPLIGAVVITQRMIHRYSEYGEGDFFLVDKATRGNVGAWHLSGQVFVDYLPGEGERGTEFSESFVLSKNGKTFSSSAAAGQTFFHCGDALDGRYNEELSISNKESNASHNEQMRAQPIQKFPREMLGVWALGDSPCNLPVNPDADGLVVVSERKLQGYEYHVVPRKISILSRKPLKISLEGTEIYLGSQAVALFQLVKIDGEKMTLTEGQTMENYTKCR